ncbi:hypothetical protein BO85DRAFT_6436 [Aspergillus piperis CBS 112811]|uniref:Uncharacterized protein n=1 Tax=Aspergillus piperis CBS 112811 TaxID=1448313 RepID=A0A8G1VUD5_9EURO|nr:hypothetical protein BO85DRAFT_6436 [Aspergillus piperis CBS 112811]RAH62738.1 hypothetical protein BO85DRAFT_6436 [Aspergillus piperis CBS 112811]
MYVRYRYACKYVCSAVCRFPLDYSLLPNRQLKGLKVLSISTLTAWFSVWVYCGCHQHPDQLSLVSPDSLGGSWLSTDKTTHKMSVKIHLE